MDDTNPATVPRAPTPCTPGNSCAEGEPCDTHETEQAHAEGEHTFCGPTCEVEFPTQMLRNTILCRAIPGSAGMLAELERRAAAVGTEQLRAARYLAAEQRIQAVTEATILWRDRPGGDVGLAIALAGILDSGQPDPPAATALVRVLAECDRIEREHARVPIDGVDDGMREAVRRVRTAAGGEA